MAQNISKDDLPTGLDDLNKNSLFTYATILRTAFASYSKTFFI
jgi:hypothetical protein